MKFTDAQLAFLMTKMTIDDDFITEAAAFKAKRKLRTKTEKVVVKSEICTKTKKNGQPCTYKVKIDGLCGKHASKSVASALSDEVVSETSSDVSSINDLAESLSQTAIAEAMEEV
jgi:hypothetical protein